MDVGSPEPDQDGETFECETCQRTFSNEKNLAHHVRTHHSDEPSEDADQAEKVWSHSILICWLSISTIKDLCKKQLFFHYQAIKVCFSSSTVSWDRRA